MYRFRAMVKAPTRPKRRQALATREGGKITRPNRLYELWRARGWTAADVAEKVRQVAEERGDRDRLKTAEGTISRLSTGALTLDQDWMLYFARVFGVSPGEILTRPLVEGVRPVKVTHCLQANTSAGGLLPEDKQHTILVPDDEELQTLELYAAEVRGPSMNLRYPDGAIVILSPVDGNPDEVVEGRRYHVVFERAPKGKVETVKRLMRREGRLWLVPESDHPEFQTWHPLDKDVRIAGRVRRVYLREA